MRRRSAASALRAGVHSFSLTSNSSRADSHSCGETIGGMFIATPPSNTHRRRRTGALGFSERRCVRPSTTRVTTPDSSRIFRCMELGDIEGDAYPRHMASGWPSISYEAWRETCDTLHAHTQVLGKLAAEAAPPEPQLQHAALRLTARGWETAPLPAPNGSGGFVALLDLHRHEAVVETSGGEQRAVPLTPDRPVGEVARGLLAAVAELAGPVEIDPAPQEVPWSQPLDEDEEHAHYDTGQVASY